jgi:hypothetical protein
MNIVKFGVELEPIIYIVNVQDAELALHDGFEGSAKSENLVTAGPGRCDYFTPRQKECKIRDPIMVSSWFYK